MRRLLVLLALGVAGLVGGLAFGVGALANVGAGAAVIALAHLGVLVAIRRFVGLTHE